MGTFIDETGKRYSRLLVVKRETNIPRGHVAWLCKCDCGNVAIVGGNHLRSGHTTSCGCVKLEYITKLKKTHGFARHGKKERLYEVWTNMITRTTNPRVPTFKYYGEKGVSMCAEWANNYVAFRTWSLSHGYDKDAKRGKCTIDRINQDGNYEPGNCRWVNMRAQGNNRRNNRIIEHDGIRLTVSQWERRLGIKRGTLSARLFRGWSDERALTQPFWGRVGDKSCD